MELKITQGVLPDHLVQAYQFCSTGQIDQASILFDEATIEMACKRAQHDPGNAYAVYLVLAKVAQQLGRFEDARTWYHKILEHRPDAVVLNELASIAECQGRRDEMIHLHQEALDLEPNNMWYQGNVAVDRIYQGDIVKGVEILRQIVESGQAGPVLHSKLLWYAHYLPEVDQQWLFEIHKLWGRRYAPMHLAQCSHDNSPDPDRRLRIGYISADFRMHSVAYNFEAVLNGRDSTAVEMVGYGHIQVPDHVTERLASKFDMYRNIYGLDDRKVVEVILNDRIDILVAIGGFTDGNRLTVLARKPAPIQVDFQGINTTGIRQVDYRFVDKFLDPPGSEAFYVERPIYLSEGIYCYTAPEFAPAVEPLPAESKGLITFGSFNSSLKINDSVIRLWADVLQAVPHSCMILKLGSTGGKRTQQRILKQFGGCGIDPQRIIFKEWMSPRDHLSLYNQIDIALDTYPFNGCMTILEGLWMGVPCITLVGALRISRAGWAILHPMDLEFFAAASPDEYVAKATALARQPQALAKIRSSLRARMKASSLCQTKQYAQALNKAYRDIWKHWCKTHAGPLSYNQDVCMQSMQHSVVGRRKE